MEVTSLESASQILLENNEIHLANALCAKGLQQDQRNIELIKTLGFSSFRSENYEGAKICFDQLKALTNSFESYFHYAKACEALGQWEWARESYLDALLLSTTRIDLLFESYKNLGNIFLKEKNLDMAEDFYHKAYTLAPESQQLLVNLGTLEMQKEDSSLAIEKYRKALQINPRFSPAWVGMALCYQNFGEDEMAWASLLKALETDPNNTIALLMFANLSVKMNEMPLAIEKFMSFFDRGHFDSTLSSAFIELCLHANRIDLARIELERALLWDPKQVDLLNYERALNEHGY